MKSHVNDAGFEELVDKHVKQYVEDAMEAFKSVKSAGEFHEFLLDYEDGANWLSFTVEDLRAIGVPVPNVPESTEFFVGYGELCFKRGDKNVMYDSYSQKWDEFLRTETSPGGGATSPPPWYN